ncbi:MAG: DNA polymerase III subunit gamma/tau [Pseudomonadota bacterium]
MAQNDYSVLARKYRPQTFNDLIGQEVLTRILTNALTSQRLAQAYLFTGTRGVGKTTTARVIAKAVNCTQRDQKQSAEPCNQCDNCTQISEANHIDVLEIDAASYTSINDIREIIDNLQYRPLNAAYKVIILDEVHMLSNSAFNALLKTLEEPPEQVIFIFATTELRKIPTTILSRCQRFDLARVPITLLEAHFENICKKENIHIEKTALTMIARASDGSVRDGLSILDQARSMYVSSHSPSQITTKDVTSMLGLQDHEKIFQLLKSILSGQSEKSLEKAISILNCGSDPIQICKDLLDACYWLTRLKISPDLANHPDVPEIQRSHGHALADPITLSELTRIWQGLLKILNEMQIYLNTRQVLEIGLIRLTHLASMPAPDILIKSLTQKDHNQRKTKTQDHNQQLDHTDKKKQFDPPLNNSKKNTLQRFENVIQLAHQSRNGLLCKNLMWDIYLVSFEPESISIRLGQDVEPDFIKQLKALLKHETGQDWEINVKTEGGDIPIMQRLHLEGQKHPLFKALCKEFPDIFIHQIDPLWLEQKQTPHHIKH